MNRILTIAVLMAAVGLPMKAQNYELASPDGTIRLEINTTDGVFYSVSRGDVLLLSPSQLSMTLSDGTVFGSGDKLRKVNRRSEDSTVDSPLYKKASVRDNYNELTLSYKQYDIVFRAYNEGVAYRFVAKMKAGFEVASEQAEYNFPDNWQACVPYVVSKAKGTEGFNGQFNSSFENTYKYHPLSDWQQDKLAFLPITVEASDGVKLCVTESALVNYPGMYLLGQGGNSLHGVWSPCPVEKKFGGRRLLYNSVDEWQDYIAEASATETFPWRVLIVAPTDKDLLESDLAYVLGTPAEGDYSWVQPGKVAWDWWNNWNLYGVDFVSGINNETYKYYIDFAASKGIDYVVLDEGWYDTDGDLLHLVPEIDLPSLVAYGNEKGVGLILWVGYYSLETNLDAVVSHYAQMGIKGFKVDFFDGDDQKTISDEARIAKVCAQYKMILDYHGASKPAGLQRTYPNVLNFEGVYGLENAKWMSTKTDHVTYDVTIPFARNVAGPMDYTQGAMRNSNKENFRAVSTEAMSQGTRCRQLAEYVVFTAPLSMLCDSPSNYLGEPECTDFIVSCPEVWDETVALAGAIGDYVAVARRSGDTWYVGAMTDWEARDLTLDLSTIGVAGKAADTFRDGVNADKAARDYKREMVTIPDDGFLTIHLAPGGGWVAVIR